MQDPEAIHPHITFLGGYQAGQNVWLDSAGITFGREMDNTIVLNDDSAVSRHHARIVAAQDGFWLEDLGSSNGTFVNGQRLVSPVLLRNGDQFKIGTTIMSVNLPHQVVRAAAPARAAATPAIDRRLIIAGVVVAAIILLAIVAVVALGGS